MTSETEYFQQHNIRIVVLFSGATGFRTSPSLIQINVRPCSNAQCDCSKLRFQCKQQTKLPNFQCRLCISGKIYMRPCNTLDNNITPTNERPC
jgi:hypothetical protein